MRSGVRPEQVALRLRQPVVLASSAQDASDSQAQAGSVARSNTFSLSHTDIAAEHSLILNLCRAIPRRRAFSQDQAFRDLALTLVEHRLLVFTVQEEDVLRSRRQQHAEQAGSADRYRDSDDAETNGAQPTKVLVTDAATWYPYLLLLRLLLRDAALMALLASSFPELLKAIGDLVTFFCASGLWEGAEEQEEVEVEGEHEHEHEQGEQREQGAEAERLNHSPGHRSARQSVEQQGRGTTERRGSHARARERATSSTSSAQLGLPHVAQERVCVELAAIVQRIARHPDGPAALVSDACRADEALVLLMGHDERGLVTSAAHALLALALAGNTATRALMAESSTVSLCLQALDSATGELRLTLLRLLVALGDQTAARRDMMVYDAPRQFTALLQVPDLDVRLATVHCIERLCTEHEDEVRLSGMVPQLAKILANYVTDTAHGDDNGDGGGGAGQDGGVGALVPVSSSTVTSLPPPIELASPAKHTALKCSAMSALTALCVQEVGAVQVQECNVIYFTARLLVGPVLQAHRDGLLTAASVQGSRPTTPAIAARPRAANTGDAHHDAHGGGGGGMEEKERGGSSGSALSSTRPGATTTGAARGSRRPSTAPRKSRVYKPPTQVLMEQACAMRLLRFLFSAERNRRYFKRLFPPDLFSWFIDVGHYQGDLPVYLRLVRHIYRMTPPAIERMDGAVEDTNVNKQPSRHVNKYGLLEKLGEGSFGCVYRAVRAGTEQMYAVKEIPLRNPAVFGQSDTEQAKALQRIENEVRIMQGGLRHPNVVRYETSFVEKHTLYIVMEMVEGASLQDHLNALVEKKQSMEERRVWRIFVQICNGLYYMHREKKVVHRDLSPSNVMLGWYDKVTIVDFGLSRQRNTGNTLMESSVGTLSYSCPEIVTNQKYNDKADIWALGCLLYQLATLRPPFATSNMLALAKRIVEGTYDPIPESRSEMLRDTVSVCLTPNPDLRPDITEVCQAIGPALMVELDALARTMEAKNRMIDRERTLKRRFRRDAKAAQDAVQRLLTASQQLPLCKNQLSSSSLSSASLACSADVGNAHDAGQAAQEGERCRRHCHNAQQQMEQEGLDADASGGSGRSRALWQTRRNTESAHDPHGHHRQHRADSRSDDDDDDDDEDAELVEDVFASPTATMRPPSTTTGHRRQSLRRKASHLKHSASTSVLLDPRKHQHQHQHHHQQHHHHHHYQTGPEDARALEALRETRFEGGCSGRDNKGAHALSGATAVGTATATNHRRHHHEHQQHSGRAQSQGQEKRQRHSTRRSWRQSTPPSPSGHATPRIRSAARGRPSSSTAGVIRLPANKLRPVSDPIVLLLTQLKKVMFVCTQPPDVRANPARHVVVRFQQILFKPATTSAAMKEHLRKLQQAVPVTIVDIDFGIAGRYAREIALRDSTEAARALSRLQRHASSSSSLPDPALAFADHSGGSGGAGSGRGPVPVHAVPTAARSMDPAHTPNTGTTGGDHAEDVTVSPSEDAGHGGGERNEEAEGRSSSGRQRTADSAYLVRVPSMDDGNPITSDVFVARNTLTYQQLHRIVELELQRCGYYDTTRSTGSKSSKSTAADA